MSKTINERATAWASRLPAVFIEEAEKATWPKTKHALGAPKKKLDRSASQVRRYRKAAEQRGLLWALTKEQSISLFQGDCTYCGASPSAPVSRRYHPEYRCNGIDRVDNTLGYDIDNCVSCCTACNFMKRGMTIAEFVEQIRRIHAHLNL